MKRMQSKVMHTTNGSLIQQGVAIKEGKQFKEYISYLLNGFCIPPIFVKLAVTKTKKLSKYVQPIYNTESKHTSSLSKMFWRRKKEHTIHNPTMYYKQVYE